MKGLTNEQEFQRSLKNLIINRVNWLGVMFGALLYMTQRPGH